MNSERSDPPRVGIWLLEHFYRGGGEDALIGDLIERFHEGQTRGWFMRQVLVAIGVSAGSDIFKGAVAMQLSINALKIVSAMAVAGAILALPVTHFMPQQYVSMGAMTAISTTPEPLTPRQLQDCIGLMRSDLLSRTALSEIIRTPSLDLYKPQRQRIPMAEITQQMRKDTDVWGVFYPDHKRIALWVKFTYPDRYKAQSVVNALLARMDDPGRPGKLEVMRPATLPDSPIPQQRWPLLLRGLVAGLSVGVIVALFSQRGMKWTLKLAACALAGFVLTAAVTFLIPDKYTSNAVVRANAVARFEQQVQNAALLTDAIGTVHLYPNDHTNALTRMQGDLKLTRLASQADGSGVVQIAFTYSGDRYKAQEAIYRILDRVAGDAAAAHDAALASQPFEPHSPTTLPPRPPLPMEMIDPANLPEQPTSPKRLFIALAGMAAGLLWGGLGMRGRRPVPATPAGAPS